MRAKVDGNFAYAQTVEEWMGVEFDTLLPLASSPWGPAAAVSSARIEATRRRLALKRHGCNGEVSARAPPPINGDIAVAAARVDGVAVSVFVSKTERKRALPY